MLDLKQRSPYGTYLEHCRKGELAYQVSAADGKAVFYPRVAAPGTGRTDLEWRVSKGLGTVYATTVVYYKDEKPLNVALIDLDEGFRMMTNIIGVADPVNNMQCGMRVRVSWQDQGDGAVALPMFAPV